MKRNLFAKLIGTVSAVLVLSIGINTSKAQTAASYIFTALPGTYTPLTGGVAVPDILTDDASSGMLPIGFDFNFCGTLYNQVKVNSNGWLSFDDVFPIGWEMYGNEDYIFNAPTMTPVIWALWDDQGGDFSSAQYLTTGTSPNRIFTMEWRDWEWYLGQQATISYQIRLHETTNQIEIIYNQEPGSLTPWLSESATIGIANDVNDFQTLSDASTNPTSSSTIFYTNISDKPASGQIYMWSPPLPCSGTPDAGSATASVTSLACEGSSGLALSGSTIATELEYQWQYSTDGTTWLDLGPVQTTIASNTGTITETTQFRAIVTCVPSGESATSSPVTVTVGPPVAGTTMAAPDLVCNGGSSTLSAVESSTVGVNYQWQSSPDNVTFTDIPSATSSTYTTPGLVAPTYYRVTLSCASSGAPANTASTMVDVLPTAAPAVNPSSLTVDCGDPAIMNATMVSGASLRWYDVPVGGTTLAMGSPAILFPTTNTTYYVENSTPNAEVTTINTANSAVVDHNSLSGDDRGGIALSNNYVYYSGDGNVVRFNKTDLTGGISLTQRDGYFGSAGELWQLGNATTAGGSYQGDDDVDMLYGLDEDLQLTGNNVALSQSIYLQYGSFVAPGMGYVLLYDGNSTIYHVDIATGAVTTLSTTVSNFIFYGSENWASYGWAELIGSHYNIVFRGDFPSESILKYDVTDDNTTSLQAFTDLSDMACIAYDGSTNRMYFHYEGSGEFGGTTETLGYLGVDIAPSGCAGYSRTPVQVTVNPITATMTPTGTINICVTGSGQTLTAMAGASYQWYLNGNPIAGATSQTYNATTAGDYTVEVTTQLGCSDITDPTTITVDPGVPPSVAITVTPDNDICAGTSVTFNATPTNGGTGTSYQWTVNGANVGTNSDTYTTSTLADGDDVNVIMTVGTGICPSSATATSNTITMAVTDNQAPTLTLTANPGTTVCVDDDVLFTTTATNAGTSPTYQWTVNGNPVGTNSTTYTATAGSLNSGDVVSVTMTSSSACALPQTVSQNVTMTVDPLTAPTVTITVDQVSICQGTMVTFTATDNAPGGDYQWLVNGSPSGPNSATYTFAPNPGDVISLDFTPPAAGCYENITVNSNAIPMDVTPGLPTQATVSAVPEAAEGSLVTVYANLFNFNLDYTIDWYIDNVYYTTTTTLYMSFVKGPGVQEVYAVANNSGSGCYLAATSNTITINGWSTSVGSNAGKTIIEVYPNPFHNTLVVKGLEDGDQVYIMNALGQTVQQWNLDKVVPEQQLQINDLASGSYMINIRDKNGVFKELKKLQKQ